MPALAIEGALEGELFGVAVDAEAPPDVREDAALVPTPLAIPPAAPMLELRAPAPIFGAPPPPPETAAATPLRNSMIQFWAILSR